MNKFDLEERVERFGESIIDFCKTISQNAITKPIINQLIRSGTSVGANYFEANGASSRKDFRNKIYICRKEAQETRHWLRMLLRYFSNDDKTMNILRKESEELVLIFSKITKTIDANPLK